MRSKAIWRELSAVINDRPLSYSDADPGESSFFVAGYTRTLTLRSIPSVQGILREADRLRGVLRQRRNYFCSLSCRWHREYIFQLRTANLDNSGRLRPLRDGTLCLVKEDNRPRLKWNLAPVVRSHPGLDGRVRTYTVRFVNGFEGQRAAQVPIPLQVPDQQNIDE